jgi:hypothetical protein
MHFAQNSCGSLPIVYFAFLIFSITLSTSMCSLFHPNTAGVPPEVERALQVVRKLLDQNKNPMIAADVDHDYDDKYSLVEFVTNTGIAATLNVLEQLDGFNEEILKQVLVVVNDQKRSMTLRLAVEEDCEFLEETKRTVESPTSHQVRIESSGDGTDGGGTPTTKTYTHKTLTALTEYHWKCGLRHSLVLFAGTDPSTGIVLGTRTGTTRLVTTMKKHPYPPQTRPPIDLDLTFLMRHVDKATLIASFKIDREQAKTPRRNKQAEEALQFTGTLLSWLGQCLYYFQVTIRQELLRGNPETRAEWLSKINSTDVFAPVAPLFMEPSEEHGDIQEAQMERHGLVSLPSPPAGPLISLKDTTLFLKEQSRSLAEALMSLMGNFPDPNDMGQLISGYEAKLVLLWLHLQDIANQWSTGIQYVEQMLYNQLVTAVGKEVTAEDFQGFLKFHNARLMGKNYAPRPFCYAIRQPNQYPDGVLSITANTPNFNGRRSYNRDSDTIETFSHRIPGDTLVAPMLIPLNAATTVEFIGDQFLHGWVDTQFESVFRPVEHFVCARARQFSCFLLLVGSISGPNEFTPKDAILLQDRDEVLIPLLTTALPSAKEFRDAVRSLSPEQARFAKSFRAMQLDSSVFGLCVIQVKPQMEALLNLPPNALTKEIQLTQDLLTLFAQYQVPPTLVSYGGNDAAAMVEKVTAVKEHVKGVLDVVKSIKEESLQEEARKTAMHKEKVRQTVQLHSVQRQSQESTVFKSCFPSPVAPSLGLFGSPMGSSPGVLFDGCGPVVANSACFSAPAPDLALPASSRTLAMSQQVDDCNDSVEFGESEGFDDLHDQFSDLDLLREKGDSADPKGWMIPSLDFATIPKKLDRVFESFDKEGALRTMTIKTGDEWTRTRQENLLTNMKSTRMTLNDKKTETNKALDLLDALSRSGSLPIASGELHVIIGVRHAFERNVMATVIEENVNPIEKVDFTSLLIGSTVHQVDIPTLLANSAEPPTLVLKSRAFPPLMMSNGNVERQES